ncbi:MAG: LamG-like jellyroll fold domain-containing protein [Candidatus Altimarinota bacterium]
MKIEKYKGFTLVELIIVITILTILATIAFISFSSYLKSSRDTNRVTTLKNIETGLELHVLKTGSYPMPDNPTEISFSGNSLRYQGYIGDSTTQLLNISKKPQDPLDKGEYIYSINENKKKFSILGYFEENQAAGYIINSTYANFLNRIPKITSGKEVPILIQTSNNLSISGVSIDVGLSQKDELYDMYYGDMKFTGTGYLILTAFIGKNKKLVKFDDKLAGYWDMETTTTDGKLKDLTHNENDGIPQYEGGYLTGTFVGNSSEGIHGKSTYFSDNKYFKIPASLTQSINSSGSMSFSIWFKRDSGDEEMNLYSKHSGSDTYSHNLFIGDDNNFKFYNGNNGYSQNVQTNSGTWYNIMVTYDPYGQMITYLNGVKIVEEGVPNGYASDGPFDVNDEGDFYIGTKKDYWGFFNGYIDELRVFNRILTDEEVMLINYIK